MDSGHFAVQTATIRTIRFVRPSGSSAPCRTPYRCLGVLVYLRPHLLRQLAAANLECGRDVADSRWRTGCCRCRHLRHS